jgi:hypothetical protein
MSYKKYDKKLAKYSQNILQVSKIVLLLQP